MASGRTHDRTAILLSFVLATAGQFLSPYLINWFNTHQTTLHISVSPLLVLISSAGVLLHLWISPDLDLAKSNALRRWGPLRFVWRPYRSIIPRHRHVLSHGPVIGTLGRVFYLATPFSPWLGLGWLTADWAQAMILGLMLADTMHWIMDGMPIRI